MDYLSQNCKVVNAVVPSAGAVANLTPVEVDARGFSRAMFIVSTGAAVALATFDVKVQKAATAGGALADVTGAGLTQVLAATGASKTFLIDVTVDVAKPYMKITGAVGTQTMANAVTCILYNGSGTYPKSDASTETLNA